MTWSLSDVIKLNRSRSKLRGLDGNDGKDIDGFSSENEDDPPQLPSGIPILPGNMVRADSAPATVEWDNTTEPRKSMSKHRTPATSGSVVMSMDDFSFLSGGMGGNGVPATFKPSTLAKNSTTSLKSVREGSLDATASIASSSPTIGPVSTPIVGPAVSPSVSFASAPTPTAPPANFALPSPVSASTTTTRLPSLTDLALTAQAAHHREAASTAMNRLLNTLNAMAQATAGADQRRLATSLHSQTVAVASTVQQLHTALAGIMLPKSLMDQAQVSAHADRGQRLMDAFRELDTVRSSLIQDMQALSGLVRQPRTPQEELPVAEVEQRAEALLHSAESSVAGARAVARQKEVLARLLSRDQLTSTTPPTPTALATPSESDAVRLQARRTKSIGQLRTGTPTLSPSVAAMGAFGTAPRRPGVHRRGVPSEGHVVVQRNAATTEESFGGSLDAAIPLLPKSRSNDPRRAPPDQARPSLHRHHTTDAFVGTRPRTPSDATTPLVPSEHALRVHASADHLSEVVTSRMTRVRRGTDASILLTPTTGASHDFETNNSGSGSSGYNQRARRPSMPSIDVAPLKLPPSPRIIPHRFEPPKSAGPHMTTFSVTNPLTAPPTFSRSHADIRSRSCSVGSLKEFSAISNATLPAARRTSPVNGRTGTVHRRSTVDDDAASHGSRHSRHSSEHRQSTVSQLSEPSGGSAEGRYSGYSEHASVIPETGEPPFEPLDAHSNMHHHHHHEQQHQQHLAPVQSAQDASHSPAVSFERSRTSMDTVVSSMYGYEAVELTADNAEQFDDDEEHHFAATSHSSAHLNDSYSADEHASTVDSSAAHQPQERHSHNVDSGQLSEAFTGLTIDTAQYEETDTQPDQLCLPTQYQSHQRYASGSSAGMSYNATELTYDPHADHTLSDTEGEVSMLAESFVEEDSAAYATGMLNQNANILPSCIDDSVAASEASEGGPVELGIASAYEVEGNVLDGPEEYGRSTEDEDECASPTSPSDQFAPKAARLREEEMNVLKQAYAAKGAEFSDSDVQDTPPSSPPTTIPKLPTKPKNWYLGYDYRRQDIMFNGSKVSGGTLEALVERLTLHDQAADMDFTKAFLLCFRCFCQPQRLLALLIQRFTLQPPDGLTTEELELWRTKKLIPLRLRVFNITKTWLESYFIPQEDSVVLEDMKVFIKSIVYPEMPAVADRLMRLATKRIDMGEENLPAVAGAAVDSAVPLSPRVIRFGQFSLSLRNQSLDSVSAPTPSATPTVSRSSQTVTDLDPTEVANQLTLMDSRLFCAITPRELIGQEFSKKEGSLAVNVKAMSTLSTQVTTWVAETILDEPDVKRRAALIKYFVKVGDRCLGLKNYNSVFAIFSALNGSNIQRLKRTWKLVSNKTQATFANLSRACDCTRNFAAYRARLKQELAPCLPFMGVYLTDLTFIEDGNAKLKRCTTATHIMINFSKYLKTVQLLNEIQRFQVAPYAIPEVTSLQVSMRSWFESSFSGGDQETMYQASLRLEPREG